MTNHCPYCVGVGYFQLVLGGSETCPSCLGTGNEKRQEEDREEVRS
ncbi:YuiA family protein [Ammoniphilus sp. CFH 90114]|nr:YuiA family protein [Ammoniphilus sp. CFH 90114]